MAKTLEGKVALVTGGGSGIGKASAVQLAKEGANVALADINERDAQETKEEIEANGGEAFIIETDVSKEEEIEQCYKQLIDRFGRLDVIFANAGVNGKITPIEDMAVEEWQQTIDTNLKSTFLTVKHAIPHMKQEGGSIIITSSVNGNRTFSNFGFSAYSSSKAGQMALGKMAALELAKYHIRVNVICPGAIETNIEENTHPEQDNLEKIKIPVEFPEGNQPLQNRPGHPEEVADLIVFLGSDASRHISGTELYVDGAASLL
ncbi:3-ketoacyl-ACP reductase [Halobacillus andaensis]|uniref:3-ketoacyl-ACP reductase n=1 Tax=Halobacillus andaensis TaxID=1176239 RepID=A0A917B802_HALAA|nr:SDR family NAD(P)-dependent oxidoreductase [Halobacillus andaensis]MBP2006455.1 NAD(P)-dependent dehydrogenase (short-subunit alcohol dehydrogenase family) [Halobacillus andaensis]GGF27504.1 3-ketoacyl-ACP reductase [Halobacillus andaensis]